MASRINTRSNIEVTMLQKFNRETGKILGFLMVCVVATTYHKGQMISLMSKPQSGSIMWEFHKRTRQGVSS